MPRAFTSEQVPQATVGIKREPHHSGRYRQWCIMQSVHNDIGYDKIYSGITKQEDDGSLWDGEMVIVNLW